VLVGFKRVVVALKETVPLRAEIDEVIEARAGVRLQGTGDRGQVTGDRWRDATAEERHDIS